MTNKEKIKKYVDENCINCKNKNKNEDLCEIRICKTKDEVKCVNYEKEFNFQYCMRKDCRGCNRYKICFKEIDKDEKMDKTNSTRIYKKV